MTFVVGLTGGIGSGKSTVARLFAERGAALIDTDEIAHALTAPNGAAMPAIADAFGKSALRADGGLDRAAMRSLVFSDPSARTRLEAILHPLIRAESSARCAASSSASYVLLAIPLLIELGNGSGYRERIDRILVVDCTEDVQLARVMARNGLTAEAVQAIIATQACRTARQAAADDLLCNDDGLEALVPQVESLHRRYLNMAAAKLRKPADSCKG
jgi:dephospho-CoA kinase